MEQPFLDSDMEFLDTLCNWLGSDIGYSKTLDVFKNHAHKYELTDLANRAGLIEKLEHCLERSNTDKAHDFAVLFIDLDSFKQVNDGMGHKVGDALLKQVSQHLDTITCQEDSLGRYGSDEFIIILEDVSQEQAETMADRIKKTLNSHYLIKGHEIDIGASVGFAFGSVDELIERADRMMYEEKRNKNTL